MTRRLLIFILFSLAVAAAQMPAPEAPRVYVDTTWNPPTGVTWAAHTSADFRNALTAAQPGDTIVLDAGVTYPGYFTVPAKVNPNGKWIYIMSSALVGSSQVMRSGVQVSPTLAPYMPKIVTTTNGTSALTIAAGANHIRLAGLEITTQASSSNALLAMAYNGNTIPDSITVDRCYIHGDETHDSHRGVEMNASNAAVIDSYISDIHYGTNEAQAIGLWWTPGPLKIVDNFLSATTQEVLFGGAGGLQNPYVPSDVEIRNNHLFKPLAWDAVGITVAPNAKWLEKNNLEFKAAQRVIVDSNVMENVWVAGQAGFSVLFTPLTSQSGNNAVVDDILFTNNVLKNVASGFQWTSHDPACATTAGCTSPGEARRIVMRNNLILLGATNQLQYNNGYNFAGYFTDQATDYVFQHNTVVPPPDRNYCGGQGSISFQVKAPFDQITSHTHNVWVLDNVLCRQLSGPRGWVGQFPYVLTEYMGDPSPVEPRLYGNVLYAPVGDRVYPMPAHNYVSTVPPTYVDPANGNYQLASPNWTDTSDGGIAGYTPNS